MYKDFMVNNKVGEKKAKGQVYDFIIEQLPDTKHKTLCRQTQNLALRIDDLFEKIGMDKLQYIKTYSADTISKFTDPQLQTIIDHFTEKPNMEFTDEAEDEEQDDDLNNVLEVLSPKESTEPTPLAHVSNSSDNSKEESCFDEDMFFNGANPTKVNTATSDNDVYFDEANEEVPSGPDNTHDGGYDGYGGYNEYGERDRGYYYRDGRYERKVSPMMSPIISPVTA